MIGTWRLLSVLLVISATYPGIVYGISCISSYFTTSFDGPSFTYYDSGTVQCEANVTSCEQKYTQQFYSYKNGLWTTFTAGCGPAGPLPKEPCTTTNLGIEGFTEARYCNNTNDCNGKPIVCAAQSTTVHPRTVKTTARQVRPATTRHTTSHPTTHRSTVRSTTKYIIPVPIVFT